MILNRSVLGKRRDFQQKKTTALMSTGSQQDRHNIGRYRSQRADTFAPTTIKREVASVGPGSRRESRCSCARHPHRKVWTAFAADWLNLGRRSTMINGEATTSGVRVGTETSRRRIDRHKCETAIRQIVLPGVGDDDGGGQVGRRVYDNFYNLLAANGSPSNFCFSSTPQFITS